MVSQSESMVEAYLDMAIEQNLDICEDCGLFWTDPTTGRGDCPMDIEGPDACPYGNFFWEKAEEMAAEELHARAVGGLPDHGGPEIGKAPFGGSFSTRKSNKTGRCNARPNSNTGGSKNESRKDNREKGKGAHNL